MMDDNGESRTVYTAGSISRSRWFGWTVHLDDGVSLTQCGPCAAHKWRPTMGSASRAMTAALDSRRADDE